MIGYLIIYIIRFTMCNCCLTTNFRNTCWIKNPGYKSCPMLSRSILLRIAEDYRLNNQVREEGFGSIKQYIMDTCDITCEDWGALCNLYVSSGNVCVPIKIQDSVPFQYSPEMTNLNLRWLY